MGIDPRQLLLLAIALAVPVLCYLFNRQRMILAWIGFTLFIQIFDTTILTNLPAGRIVGLLYLPTALFLVRQWMVPPARLWLINFTYLVVLGVLFGFLYPWPDISGGERPISVQAPGRTIIYLVRTLADLSLTVFVMRRLVQPGAFDSLRKWMFRGVCVSSAVGLFSIVTRVDFYVLITGIRKYALTDFRPRGLNFEARALGLACAYGLILGLSKERRTVWDWLGLLVITAGLLASSSTSALVAAAVGLIVVAMLGSVRVRMAMIITVVIVAVAASVVLIYAPTTAEQSQYAIISRLQGRGTVEANNPANSLERVALRMDIFDASAALFLIRNPQWALIGTGPGLITLPASNHIPQGLYSAIFKYIDTLPTHGILLELSNTGLLGVVTWLVQVFAGILAFRWLDRHGVRLFPNRAARTLFLAGAALYAVQNSPSPTWAVFLGIGWAAAGVRASVAARGSRAKPAGVDLARAAVPATRTRAGATMRRPLRNRASHGELTPPSYHSPSE